MMRAKRERCEMQTLARVRTQEQRPANNCAPRTGVEICFDGLRLLRLARVGYVENHVWVAETIPVGGGEVAGLGNVHRQSKLL